MTRHGTDEVAVTGCPCAACHERRRELDVLVALTAPLPNPHQLALFEVAA